VRTAATLDFDVSDVLLPWSPQRTLARG
jgi:hypothetical protein